MRWFTKKSLIDSRQNQEILSLFIASRPARGPFSILLTGFPTRFFRTLSDWEVNLTTDLNPSSNLRINGAILPPPFSFLIRTCRQLSGLGPLKFSLNSSGFAHKFPFNLLIGLDSSFSVLLTPQFSCHESCYSADKAEFTRMRVEELIWNL